nr:hypothetical protein [Tanacetum cinerariifolium]
DKWLGKPIPNDKSPGKPPECRWGKPLIIDRVAITQLCKADECPPSSARHLQALVSVDGMVAGAGASAGMGGDGGWWHGRCVGVGQEQRREGVVVFVPLADREARRGGFGHSGSSPWWRGLSMAVGMVVRAVVADRGLP